jgi:hypothetical protein
VPRDCVDSERFGFVVSCRDRLVEPMRETIRTVGWVGVTVAGLLGLALIVTLGVYGDVIMGGGGAGGEYGRDVSRLAEARQLLREGSLPAHQRA